MDPHFEQTEEDLAMFEDTHLVEGMEHADDLVHVVVGESYNWAARERAAEKLLEMWDGQWTREYRNSGITLDHLAYVGDHAEEPHKSRANQIIRENI